MILIIVDYSDFLRPTDAAGGVLASLVNQQGEEPFLVNVVGEKLSALSELETYASSAKEDSSDDDEEEDNEEEEDDDEDEEEAG
jgi:hypothetical protein